MLKGIYIEIETRGNVFDTKKTASFWFSSTKPGEESAAVDTILAELKKEISKAVRDYKRPHINVYGYDRGYQPSRDGFRYINNWNGEVEYRAWDERKEAYAIVRSEDYVRKDNKVDSAKMAREITKQMKDDIMGFILKHGRTEYECMS